MYCKLQEESSHARLVYTTYNFTFLRVEKAFFLNCTSVA